jgi:hypothetical protein
MKWRKGARPWPVNAFAAIFVFWGLWELLSGLFDLPSVKLPMQFGEPGSKAESDARIIFLSADFTIVLIPVVVVWGMGSRVARTVVTCLTLVSWGAVFVQLWALLSPDPFEAMLFAKHASIVLAVLLLFRPSADEWMKKKTVLPPPPSWD